MGVAGIVTEVLMVYEPLIIFSDCANIIKVCLVRLCPQFFEFLDIYMYVLLQLQSKAVFDSIIRGSGRLQTHGVSPPLGGDNTEHSALYGWSL